MASSSSTMHFSDQASYYSCQTESEMESSKIRHWSNLNYSTTASEWSVEKNFKDFELLTKYRDYRHFFRYYGQLELGEKISEGAQAVIYEARLTRPGSFDYVAKVMKGDAPLQAFQTQWPIGMLLSLSRHKYLLNASLISIDGGTLLKDKKLKGRFAFVMRRRWGDLRLLIDRRMKEERTTVGPFFIDQVIHLMLSIAEDMEGLHNEHDIIHRDLKASNVLVWGPPPNNRVNQSGTAPSKDGEIRCVVADFECSMGVLGTRWWRAPEILQKIRARPGSEVQCTRQSDVYSYAMTCYEIVTGQIPFGQIFEGCSSTEASHEIVSGCLSSEGPSATEADQDIVSVDEVLNGRRPNLPDELPSFLRSIITSCWHSDPKKRPPFSAIRKMLWMDVTIDNESNKSVSIIKVQQPAIRWLVPKLQKLDRLLSLNLWVSKAESIQSHTTRGMIVQYFEVTDGKGRKVSNKFFTERIVENLRSLKRNRWDYETSDETITVAAMYLIQIMAKTGGHLLLKRLLANLWKLNFEVYGPRCWTHIGGLTKLKFQVLKPQWWTHIGHCEGAMYVKGGNMDMDCLLPLLLEEARVDCKIALRKLASRDVDLDLQNFEPHHDLQAPERPSPICINYGVEDHTTLEVGVVCLDGPELLVNVACSLVKSIIDVGALKGSVIQVHCLEEEETDGHHVRNNDEKGITSLNDFVHKHKWNICSDDGDFEKDLKAQLQFYLDEGKRELIFNLGDGLQIDTLRQSLCKNGLFISSAYVQWPQASKKVSMTVFVSSEKK